MIIWFEQNLRRQNLTIYLQITIKYLARTDSLPRPMY